MTEFKKINPESFVKDREADIQYFKKDVTVGMRPAIPGESITTIMKDGHVETHNVATDNQVVIKNPDGEQYIIDAKKFEERYEYSKTPSVDDDGFISYDAKGGPMQVIRLGADENVEFTAPWGSLMQIKAGGVIVNNGPNDIYGIQPEEFKNTYKPCTPEGEFINSPSHWLGDTSTLCEQKPSEPKIESKPKRNDLSI